MNSIEELLRQMTSTLAQEVADDVLATKEGKGAYNRALGLDAPAAAARLSELIQEAEESAKIADQRQALAWLLREKK